MEMIVMETQWYLCMIQNYPEHEGEELQKTDNLSITQPDTFDGSWYVWLPIIPRAGDTLQFAGWQVEVSRVVLQTDWRSKTGIKDGPVLSAVISIHDNVVSKLMDTDFSIESLNSQARHKWEKFARRGHDIQYFAWELRHESYIKSQGNKENLFYYRWHTRIRPIAGDIIVVINKRWRVKSVELASACKYYDGSLYLEEEF
ncbi:hypothetical protein [Roseofilum capinflatum]|uniref:Uncharacterized protein n=1 Tax=Roseofilum capinflatum BLCC-M114 TaxID=3022440 RepID=A0ABT7B6G4_9CYAN|nr:hypothetical protein [Roseofilum capinflatum]MDJ1174412.1 hypothetical protein [Roseofilum capinflatum BLCC-M114]